MAIWHIALQAGARCDLPPAAGAETGRTLYVFSGGVLVDGAAVTPPTGVVLRAMQTVELAAPAGGAGAECLILQGRPIGEPVAQYGPFVLNDRAGIEQAFADYRRTSFGGWPWGADDPVHGRERGRFARHADGTVVSPAV